MNELSRRNFFKLGASAALGAALFNFEGLHSATAFAQGNTTKSLHFTPVSLQICRMPKRPPKITACQRLFELYQNMRQ